MKKMLRAVWRKIMGYEPTYRIETDFVIFECPESALPYWHAADGDNCKITRIE